MNIDELTLGQIKQLQGLLGGGKEDSIGHPYMGKKVIIRTYSAGVHFGKLASKDGMEVILEDAIRIYYWDGAFTLSQMAMEGVTKPENCKFAMPVDNITVEAIEIIPCSKNAVESLEGVECKKQ